MCARSIKSERANTDLMENRVYLKESRRFACKHYKDFKSYSYIEKVSNFLSDI